MKIYKIMTTMFLLAIGISSCGKAPENSSPSVENSEDTPSESQDVIQEEYTEGLSFTLLGNGTYYGVSIGTATDKNIVIPGSYNNLPVKKVLSYGFCDAFIESVTINEGVSIIEDDAFYRCNSLKKLSLPNSLIYIGGMLDLGMSMQYNKYEHGNYLGNNENPYLYFVRDDFDSNKDVFKFHKDCKIIGDFYVTTQKEIILPDEIRWIERNGFFDYRSIENIDFNEFENGLYLGNENNPYVMLVKAKDFDVESFSIHENCKWIHGGWWNSQGYDSLHLESLTIPYGVQALGYLSINAKNIVLPKGLKVLDVNYSMDDYYIPESVELLTNNSSSLGTPFSNYADSEKDLKELSINEYENCYYIGSKENPYKYCVYADNNVKSIKLHDDTKEVFDYAFASLPLESVTLNDKLEVIGEKAFYMCPSLKTINFPDSLRVIKDEAFAICPLLDNVVLPNNLYSIGYNNFGQISDKKSINYPDSLEVLGSGNPLYNLPSGLSVLGIVDSRRFSQGNMNTSMYDEETINLSNNIRYIGYGTFEDCKNLKKIKMPDRVNRCEMSLFSGCESLEEIDLNNVEYIGDHSFSNCQSLKQITLPESISGIGWGTFNNCQSLKEINIPNDVNYIGRRAFANCSSLTNIVLPDKLLGIDANSFEGCTSLKSINIPENVETIGENAFYGCSLLESIVIPSKVEVIPFETFKNCTSLKEVVISEGVKSIGTQSFENCAIEKLYIPSTVEDIGKNAFYMCNSLKEIKVDENNKFYDSRDNCNAIIETATNKLIKGCENTIIPDGIEIIGGNAFAYVGNLKEITFTEGLTTIENYAFFSSELEIIKLPNSLITIGTNVFTNSNIKEVSCYVNESLNEAFKGLSTLEKVMILGGEYIADNMFEDCENLSEVIICSSVKTIGKYAFLKCNNLTTVELGKTVEIIKYGAFSSRKIEQIVLPKSVKEIENKAFVKLSHLYYEGSEEEFKSILIDGKNNIINDLVDKNKVTYNYVEE